MCICRYIHMFLCLCLCLRLKACVRVYVCVCVCHGVLVCVCARVLICVYIDTCTCIFNFVRASKFCGRATARGEGEQEKHIFSCPNVTNHRGERDESTAKNSLACGVVRACHRARKHAPLARAPGSAGTSFSSSCREDILWP